LKLDLGAEPRERAEGPVDVLLDLAQQDILLDGRCCGIGRREGRDARRGVGEEGGVLLDEDGGRGEGEEEGVGGRS